VGLIEEAGGKWESRRMEIGSLSRNLVRLAKDLSVPVLLLSQLNREVESRVPPVPRISDLRESGDLEQDADVIVLLNRPEMYLGNRCPTEKRGVAEIDVAKNRNGRTNAVEVSWHGPTASFRPLDRWRM
jgi:replicative DNA helicase